MALIACPACKKEVSDEAKACPHCGHPLQKTAKKSDTATRKGCLGLLAIAGLLAVVGAIGSNSSGNSSSNGAPAAAGSACSSNWKKCADNSDLVNHYSGWLDVQAACKTAANDRARYGTPVWPWIPFGTYLKGKDYVSTGVVTAIEPDAQFQNGFGAMVHSRVLCTYDLGKNRVLDVNIVPR